MTERTGNEIEGLVLKAGRGGGLPLGAAQDLSAAMPFIALPDIALCPCHGPDPLAVRAPIALDLVAAGEGPQQVLGDAAVIAGFVAEWEVRLARRLVWTVTPDGAVFEIFEEGDVAHVPLGRRDVPDALLDHLNEMVAKTMVPETESSRMGGAGAGLTDND